MRLLFLTAFVVLAACGPIQLPEQGPTALFALEVDPDDLRNYRLSELSTDVREELQRPPIIPLDPDGRAIEGDHLLIRTYVPAEAPAAMARIQELGPVALNPLPDGAIEVRFTEEGFGKLQADALATSMATIERRVKNAGMGGATVKTRGDRQIIVRIPGFDDDPDYVGALLTQTGVLTFNLVDVDANPDDYQPGIEQSGRIVLPDTSLDGMPTVIFAEPLIRGTDLANAQQGFDETNRPNIAFQLHPPGAKRFGEATTRNIGRPFAIVLDNRIVSAPRIMTPIMSGSGQITGQFTREEAEQMAIILRSGSLPVRLKLVEQHMVEGQ